MEKKAEVHNCSLLDDGSLDEPKEASLEAVAD